MTPILYCDYNKIYFKFLFSLNDDGNISILYFLATDTTIGNSNVEPGIITKGIPIPNILITSII